MSNRNFSRIAVLALAAPALAHSQTFEVASIKPTDPAFTLRSIQMPLNDGMVAIRGLTLKQLIQYAWGKAEVGTGLHPSLVSGGPPGPFTTATISSPGPKEPAYLPGTSANKCSGHCSSNGFS